MVHKDLWLPDERREDMSEYGIATENLRKLMSGDDSTSASNKNDNSLFKARGRRVRIGLGKVLRDQGLFAPHALNGGVEYVFMTPSASEIMVGQSGEGVGDYALKETKLVYETIESSDAYSQAMVEYADTDFPFEDINYIKAQHFDHKLVYMLRSCRVETSERFAYPQEKLCRTREVSKVLERCMFNNIYPFVHALINNVQHEFYCCVMYSGVEYVVCCYSECISHTRQAEKGNQRSRVRFPPWSG